MSKTDTGFEWSQQGKYLYKPALTRVWGVDNDIPADVDELTPDHVHSSRAREERHSGWKTEHILVLVEAI
jgi:hypothetical protein